MTLVSRYATFLYEALKLEEAKIPIDLDASLIQGTIDTYQNGWALAVYNHRQFNGSMQFTNSIVLIGDNQFPPTTVGIAPEIKQKKVFAMNTEHTLIGDIVVDWKYRRVDGEAQEVILRHEDLLAGTDVIRDWLDDWMDNSQGTLFIPPGWQLVMDFPATGNAEDVFEIQILWAEIPLGFNIGIS